MKTPKLIFTLLAFGGIISADAGWAMMSEVSKATSKIAVKKRVPSQMVQKRSLSTQGYQPKKPIPLEFQFDNITREKIKFTDKYHERYRSDSTELSFKERIAITEKKDDHTLVVNIKKKEKK